MRQRGAAARAAAVVLVTAVAAFAAAQVQIVDSVDDLVAAFEAGGRYSVMPGEYVVREPVVVRHDLELIGLGRDAVQVEFYGAPIALGIAGDVDVTIAGLRFVYEGEHGADLIVVSEARLTMREVDVGFARLAAPSLPPLPGRENGHGSGIALIDGASLTAHDLRVAQNQLAGIEARSGAQVTLVDPTIVGNYRGLVVVGSDVRIDVRGGSVSGHHAHGLVLDAAALEAAFHDVRFFDNGLVDLERAAFWPAAVIGGTATVTFDGGTMRDTPGTGIVIGGAAQVGISGMVFEAVGGHYEGVDQPWPALKIGGSARVSVEDSAFSANAGGAVDVGDRAVLVMQNAVVEANGAWAHTRITDSGSAIVQGTTFRANQGTLFVAGSATLGLAGSELVGSAGYGLVVAVTGAASVVGSVIADNGEDGVWVDGGAALQMQSTQVRGSRAGVWVSGEALATLIDNTFSGSGAAAIVLVDAARADLQGNTISATPVGVYLGDAAVVQGSDNVFADVGEQVQDVR